MTRLLTKIGPYILIPLFLSSNGVAQQDAPQPSGKSCAALLEEIFRATSRGHSRCAEVLERFATAKDSLARAAILRSDVGLPEVALGSRDVWFGSDGLIALRDGDGKTSLVSASTPSGAEQVRQFVENYRTAGMTVAVGSNLPDVELSAEISKLFGGATPENVRSVAGVHFGQISETERTVSVAIPGMPEKAFLVGQKLLMPDSWKKAFADEQSILVLQKDTAADQRTERLVSELLAALPSRVVLASSVPGQLERLALASGDAEQFRVLVHLNSLSGDPNGIGADVERFAKSLTTSRPGFGKTLLVGHFDSTAAAIRDWKSQAVAGEYRGQDVVAAICNEDPRELDSLEKAVLENGGRSFTAVRAKGPIDLRAFVIGLAAATKVEGGVRDVQRWIAGGYRDGQRAIEESLAAADPLQALSERLGVDASLLFGRIRDPKHIVPILSEVRDVAPRDSRRFIPVSLGLPVDGSFGQAPDSMHSA